MGSEQHLYRGRPGFAEPHEGPSLPGSDNSTPARTPTVSWETYSKLLDAYTQLLAVYADLYAKHSPEKATNLDPPWHEKTSQSF